MDILNLIEQGKVKRYFRSRRKISFAGAINHITQRAPGREMLFIEKADYLLMMNLIKETVEKFNLKLFSFVLMPNHLHLLFQSVEGNLSSAMHHLFENYALYFNKKYQRKGHVFCGRFRQALCFDNSYLLACSVYIHMNPLVAGLTKNISDYRWSSVRPFIQVIDKKTFIDYRFILKLLADDIKIARKLYVELINRAIGIKLENVWDKPKALESFRNKFVASFKELMSHSNILKSTNNFDEEVENLKKTRYQRDPKTIAAKIYLIEQLRARDYKVAEIAEKLNLTRQAIYKILKNK